MRPRQPRVEANVGYRTVGLLMNATYSARNRGPDSTTPLDKRRLSTAFVPAGGAMQAFSHRTTLEKNQESNDSPAPDVREDGWRKPSRPSRA